MKTIKAEELVAGDVIVIDGESHPVTHSPSEIYHHGIGDYLIEVRVKNDKGTSPLGRFHFTHDEVLTLAA